jgi:hypothetical protein
MGFGAAVQTQKFPILCVTASDLCSHNGIVGLETSLCRASIFFVDLVPEARVVMNHLIKRNLHPRERDETG